MAQLVKSINWLAIASVKSVNWLAIASIKSIDGLDNTATYATWNPDDIYETSLSGSNLVSTWSTKSWTFWRARWTIWKSSWKWYWELIHSEVSGGAWQDWVSTLDESISFNRPMWETDNSYWFRIYTYSWWTGDKTHSNSYTAFTVEWWNIGVTDVLWVALDMDNGKVSYYKNNVLQASFTWLSWTFYPMSVTWNWKITANFWATTMAYTAPSWYNQWLYE